MHKKLIGLTLAAVVSCFLLERGYAAVPSPVAHWSFEGNGLDSSGNHHDGTLHGNVAYLPGIYGQAAQFHGQGDYFQVANNPIVQLRSTQQFSVTAYVQSATLAPQKILVHGLTYSTRDSWFLGVQGGEPDALLYPGRFVFGVRGSNGIAYTAATAPAVAGQWVHLAATYDGAALKLYVNGVLQSSMAAPRPYDSKEDLYLGGDPSLYSSFGYSWYAGLLDDVYIFDQALKIDEVKEVMQGPVPPQLAHDPRPAHGATDVLQDTALCWTAGQFAATHDVYLGKAFADVNNASRAKPAGVLVSQGQTGTTYTPPTVLDFGQAYYWRVDEVNKTPDTAIYKGNTWSFTVEPYNYPIPGASITATASSAQADMGPEKTIDGSGLNANDQHGVYPTTMWLGLGKLPTWIQYQFDAVYKLDKLSVWNSNWPTEASGAPSFGAKDVTIEYSVDGTQWATLANVPRFAKATGRSDYVANTTVNFGGVLAKYAKLTIWSTWSSFAAGGPAGLSEVRFYYLPAGARAPQPPDTARDQGLTSKLTWRPAHDVVSQKVYFGTDPNAVANGTAAAQTVTTHAFDPGPLNYGTTYYWRVDEIGAAGVYSGDVWSFTTQECAPVDDFESYNDTNQRIRDTWIDGRTDGQSGSTVGYLTAPFTEQTIIHGGQQSMPLAYDNSKAPFYSQTTRDLGAPQDWTDHGATHLALWFRGYPAAGATGAQDSSTRHNAPAGVYVVIQDSAGHSKLVAHPDPAAAATGAWTRWTIPLSDLTAAGVQTTQVRKITIGVGDRSNPKAGGAGLLYIDDVGYGHPASTMPVQAHTAQPANGAVGQGLTTTLGWQPGREGGSHKVFFGADSSAIANGTAAAQTVTDPVFDPGLLNFGTTYYWRVDEVVSPVTYPGDVWSFTTQEFGVIDDFEAYDEDQNRIYQTWIDGMTDGQSGSTVGYMTAPFAEQRGVHAGKQSMPLAYNNKNLPFFSETTRNFAAAQDWTVHGATHLDLWFEGFPATGSAPSTPNINAPAPLYLIVTDSAGQSQRVVHPNPAATNLTTWTEWRIALSDLAGVNLTTVQKLTLGVGDKNSPKADGTGLLYFDDIGFGHPVQ